MPSRSDQPRRIPVTVVWDWRARGGKILAQRACCGRGKRVDGRQVFGRGEEIYAARRRRELRERARAIFWLFVSSYLGTVFLVVVAWAAFR
jgi:hypothetical protein